MPYRDVIIIISANLHHGPDWGRAMFPTLYRTRHASSQEPRGSAETMQPVDATTQIHCRWLTVTIATAQPGHQQGRSTQTVEGKFVLGRVAAVCKLWLSLQGYKWAEIMLLLLQQAGEICAGNEGHFCLIWFLSSLGTLLCEK